MVSHLFKGSLATAITLGLAVSIADAKQLGAELWGSNSIDAEKKFLAVTEKIGGLGFVISDPHPRINDSYKSKYGSKKLDNLGFFSSAHDSKMKTLLEKYPEFGGFTPFNLHVYKKTGIDTTWAGHLRPEVMASIVGVTDPVAIAEFKEIFKPLDSMLLNDTESTRVKNLYFDSLPEKTMMKFEIKIDLGENGDLDGWIEDFQEKFEAVFEEGGYLIAGFKDIKSIYEDDFKYPAYWVYSLCHFHFSNAIFNDVPEAGVFAPCSLYMYVDPESKTLNIGMPRLANWSAIANIKDSDKIDYINKLDIEIEKLFVEELGAVAK